MNFQTLNAHNNLPLNTNSHFVNNINIFNQEEEVNLYEKEMGDEERNKQDFEKLKELNTTEKEDKNDSKLFFVKKDKEKPVNSKSLKLKLYTNESIDFNYDISSICNLGDHEKETVGLGLKNGHIAILNLALKKIVSMFEAHLTTVIDLCLMRKVDKNTLLSISDTEIKFWDLSNNFKLIKFYHESTYISSMIYLGNLFSSQFVCGFHMQIKVFDYFNLKGIDQINEKTGQSEFMVKKAFGHSSIITCFLHLTKYNTYQILSGSKDAKVIRWDLSDMRILNTYVGHKLGITSLTTLLNGYFISSSEDHTLRVWHYEYNSSVYHILLSHTEISFVINMIDYYDDNFICMGNMSGELKIVNLNTNKALQEETINLYLTKYCALTNSEFDLIFIEGDYHVRLGKVKYKD